MGSFTHASSIKMIQKQLCVNQCCAECEKKDDISGAIGCLDLREPSKHDAPIKT